jgi:hypothetical protein
VRTVLPAVWAFVGTFFGRLDPVVRTGTAGATQLAGWPSLPEEAALGPSHESSLQRHRSDWALYCYEGVHQGEWFVLPKERGTIGSSATDTVVFTDVSASPLGRFEFLCGPSLSLKAIDGSAFTVNSRTETQSYLVDYDELHLKGNRFLVLHTGRRAH